MRWKARLLGSLAVSIAATLAPPAARSVTINQPIANSQVVSTASAPSTTSEPNYVVSVGRLIAGAGSERNWVRLAYYHLLPDGTVTEGFWYYAFPTQRGKTALPGTVCIADCIQYVPPGFETGAVAKALAGTYSVDPVTGVINIKWKTRVPSSESWNPMPARTGMSEFNLKANSDGATLGHAFGSSRAPSYRGAHIGHVFDYMTKNHSDLNLNGYLRQWKAGPQTFAVDTKVYTFELATSKRCSEYCFARATNRAHYYYRTPDPNGPLARNLALEVWANGDAPACYDDRFHNPSHPHPYGALTVVDNDGHFRGFVMVEASLWPDLANDYMSVGWFSTDLLVA